MLSFDHRLAMTLGLASLIVAQTAQADSPEVVATIKPVHSLTAALMDGVGEPTLLMRSGGSPHSYALRPSEARALDQADIVVWVGENLETFLERPLDRLAANARIVTLAEADGLRLRPVREGGGWDTHDHDHGDSGHHDADHAEDHDDHADAGHDEHGDEDHAEHADADHDEHGHDDHADADHHEHDEEDHADHADAGHHEHDEEDHAEHAEADHDGHDHGALDMHVWLDPRNAAVIAAMIADALIAADPENAATYRANAAELDADLAALEQSLNERLEPVRERPFVVFHDAYQYFEARFDVNAVGSITVSPDVQPGAARLRELRETIMETGAQCVFSEPQFEPRLVETVTEGTDAESGVLDPLGAGLAAGPAQYFELMESMADSLIDCLGGPEAG